jgi:hypothetical protein
MTGSTDAAHRRTVRQGINASIRRGVATLVGSADTQSDSRSQGFAGPSCGVDASRNSKGALPHSRTRPNAAGGRISGVSLPPKSSPRVRDGRCRSGTPGSVATAGSAGTRVPCDRRDRCGVCECWWRQAAGRREWLGGPRGASRVGSGPAMRQSGLAVPRRFPPTLRSDRGSTASCHRALVGSCSSSSPSALAPRPPAIGRRISRRYPARCPAPR